MRREINFPTFSLTEPDNREKKLEMKLTILHVVKLFSFKLIIHLLLHVHAAGALGACVTACDGSMRMPLRPWEPL